MEKEAYFNRRIFIDIKKGEEKSSPLILFNEL